MTRILIADDHAMLREGLKQILAEEFAGAEFGEAATTAETLQQLRTQPWDVLILDINMPGRNGMDVLNDARRSYPRLPVLVLSSTPEDQLGIRTLRAGARGYLNKQSAAEELVNAIRKVLAGGRYLTPALSEKLVEELDRDPTRPPHELLSNREFQVFKLLVAGRCVKEIAAELSLSVKTISTYRSRVLDKLRVRNEVELAHYAHEHGLFDASRPEDRAPS
jgi:DNA-binding NarL/FixJ family response regulator